MANEFAIQILADGPRNSVVKLTGVLDTSNLAVTTAIDLSTLNQGGTGPTPTAVRIDKVYYSISSQLQLQLLWDATTDKTALNLIGYGKMSFYKAQGLQNNAGTGKTGNLNIITYGWASGTQLFTVYLELMKQGANL
jgi:hypothetical protein